MRFLLRSVGGIWSALMILLMLGSLALSVTMTLLPAVFATVAGVVEGVSGLTSVATRAQRREAALVRDLGVARSRADNLARELGARTVTYRGEKVAMRAAVKDASTRVARRTSIAAGRNIAATVGEAIPFWGIAVVVGATAWELKDACDLMGEMHELDLAFNPEDAVTDTEVCGLRVPSRAEIWQEVKASPGAIKDRMRDLFGDESETTP